MSAKLLHSLRSLLLCSSCLAVLAACSHNDNNSPKPPPAPAPTGPQAIGNNSWPGNNSPVGVGTNPTSGTPTPNPNAPQLHPPGSTTTTAGPTSGGDDQGGDTESKTVHTTEHKIVIYKTVPPGDDPNGDVPAPAPNAPSAAPAAPGQSVPTSTPDASNHVTFQLAAAGFDPSQFSPAQLFSTHTAVAETGYKYDALIGTDGSPSIYSTAAGDSLLADTTAAVQQKLGTAGFARMQYLAQNIAATRMVADIRQGTVSLVVLTMQHQKILLTGLLDRDAHAASLRDASTGYIAYVMCLDQDLGCDNALVRLSAPATVDPSIAGLDAYMICRVLYPQVRLNSAPTAAGSPMYDRWVGYFTSRPPSRLTQRLAIYTTEIVGGFSYFLLSGHFYLNDGSGITDAIGASAPLLKDATGPRVNNAVLESKSEIAALGTNSQVGHILGPTIRQATLNANNGAGDLQITFDIYQTGRSGPTLPATFTFATMQKTLLRTITL